MGNGASYRPRQQQRGMLAGGQRTHAAPSLSHVWARSSPRAAPPLACAAARNLALSLLHMPVLRASRRAAALPELPSFLYPVAPADPKPGRRPPASEPPPPLLRSWNPAAGHWDGDQRQRGEGSGLRVVLSRVKGRRRAKSPLALLHCWFPGPWYRSEEATIYQPTDEIDRWDGTLARFDMLITSRCGMVLLVSDGSYENVGARLQVTRSSAWLAAFALL